MIRDENFYSKSEEKRKNQEKQEFADFLYNAKQMELNEKGAMLETMEIECQRAMKIATHRYNQILVESLNI